MGVKPAAVAALFAAAFVSAPSNADELFNNQQVSPATMFYVSIPLGGVTAKQRAPSYGLALQGRRQYETIQIDSRLLNAFEGAALGGIEIKWLIAGAVVVGAGAYAVSQDKKRSDNYQGSQNQQQNTPPPACDPNDPCAKK